MQRIIRELHRSCQNDDGSDDLKKGTQLLEVRVRVGFGLGLGLGLG